MQINYYTGKAELLLVKAPDDANEFSIDHNIWHSRFCYFSTKWDWISIPKGNWKVLGNAFELTEEQWKSILPNEKHFVGVYPIYVYLDWTNNGNRLETATESGLSFLRHLKVYKENPYGDKSSLLINGDFEKVNDWIKRAEQWQEAQERTSKNWIALVKQ